MKVCLLITHTSEYCDINICCGYQLIVHCPRFEIVVQVNSVTKERFYHKEIKI